MLARALEMNGMTETRHQDRSTPATPTSPPSSPPTPNGAAVTWNPPLQQARNAQGRDAGVRLVQDPGRDHRPHGGAHQRAGCAQEGADRRLVRDDGGHDRQRTRPPTMRSRSWPSRRARRCRSSRRSSRPPRCSTSAADAVDVRRRARSSRRRWSTCARSSFDKGLFGQRAKSKDFVGIAFADGSVLGDPKNVKLRFTADYMKQAADGKL